MTSEERKKELLRIQEGEPYSTGIPLLYHGEPRKFNVYQIPLEFLVYNPYNGRIGSEVKSYERQNHVLNPEIPEDIKIIENLLWHSKEDANKTTMGSLLKDRQQKFGIVTADGRIIDGNRRASLLNRLYRDESIDPSQKQHCRWFQAIILPIDADKKEILRLETSYQMGEDAKVDYNPIEKYLKCGDLESEGFTKEEIASFMGVKKSEVEFYLRVLSLMNDYLETYGYDGIYTQLYGNEDSFQKLEAALRKYRSGGVSSMWDYSPEKDVTELMICAFDYIRAGFSQTDFRDIIRTPSVQNSGFFANKDLWESFRNKHFEIVEQVEEETVKDIIKDHPGANIKRLLKARDQKWKEQIFKEIEDNYNIHKDKLDNKKESNEPIRLLNKALDALRAIDISSVSFNAEKSGIKNALEELDSLSNHLVNSLNKND